LNVQQLPPDYWTKRKKNTSDEETEINLTAAGVGGRGRGSRARKPPTLRSAAAMARTPLLGQGVGPRGGGWAATGEIRGSREESKSNQPGLCFYCSSLISAVREGGTARQRGDLFQVGLFFPP
jgi:hypothetical protein